MPSLRTALALTLTAAAATLAPAGAALAATPAAPAGATALDSALPPDTLPVQSVTGAVASGVDPVRRLPLDPLSDTGVDPLDNGLSTQVADFQPLSTTAVTDQVTHGGSLGSMPVIGPASGAVTGG
ncbi:hypothetical protein OG900_15225 [Streptomyces sp. NBC_00433]